MVAHIVHNYYTAILQAIIKSTKKWGSKYMGGHFFLVVTSVFTPEHQPAFNYEVNIN
jgi:hypothetical protein